MIENTIYDRLATDHDVSTLCGGRVGGFSNGFSNGFEINGTPPRIYPTSAKANTAFPHIVYVAKLSDQPGTLQGSIGLSQYDLTLELWANDLDESTDLASAVNARVNYQQWDRVGLCKIRSDEPETQTSDEGNIYHRTLTFQLWEHA